MFKKKVKAEGRRPSYLQKSEKVISYYSASRKQLDTFERKRGRAETQRVKPKIELGRSKLTKTIVIVLVVFICVYSSLLGADPVIKINGTQYRSLKSYQIIGQQVMAGDIRNKLKFLLQAQSDSSKLMELIPEASSITVRSSLLGHNPIITINTAKPFMIFQQKGAPDFIIDQKGRASLPVSEGLKMYQSLPRLINGSGVNNKAREQVLSPDEANELLQLMAQYKADNSFPVYTLSSNPFEVDIAEVGKLYFAKYSLDPNSLAQYGSLKATEAKLKQLGQVPAQYIDVRLTNKVFYQ